MGLYDRRDEHGSCGTGFIADILGRRSRRIVDMALEALVRLTHRGAVAADGKTGDGAGLQIQLPYRLLRDELDARGIPLERDEDLALGMLFLPRGDDAERAADLVEEVVDESELRFLAWRDVPLGLDALGPIARRSRPGIRQVLLARPDGLDDHAFDRLLYLTRRRLAHRARAAGLDTLYAPSFSRRTVVYKGLMLASQLAELYLDLADPRVDTAIAVFHQRYSTNTEPDWRLAQPFRLLGHNGEINTLQGNVNWMRARERELQIELWGEPLAELLPVIQDGGSDSAMLDNVLEFMTLFNHEPLQALRILMPESESAEMSPEVRAFYDYYASLLEPWDGPAAVVFSDGRYAAALLDRNGLRPERWWQTRGGLVIVGSEAGIVDVPDGEILRKGRLGPGQMLAVDTERGVVLDDLEIKQRCAARLPYAAWTRRKVEPPRGELGDTDPAAAPGDALSDEVSLAAAQLAFGYCSEDLERILAPMAEGRIPVGSMGDDTPLAALSEQPQALYRYFRQRFAQVTNPPIDPLRERLAMSLRTLAGPWGAITGQREELAHLIDFPSPILSRGQLDWLVERGVDEVHFASVRLDAVFPALPEEGERNGAGDNPAARLEHALETLLAEAEDAVDNEASILVLSDRRISPENAPIPMLLAVAAVHRHLLAVRKRMGVSLVCDTGEPREDHHIACLIGFGATLVHPYLAEASAAALADPGGDDPAARGAARGLYRRAVEKGLLKIMSKLGVCPVASYQGAQLFETLGLDHGLVERYFPGTRHFLGGAAVDGTKCGVGLGVVARDVLAFHALAFSSSQPMTEPPDRGLYRYRKQGEYHAFHPGVFKALHKAVRTGDDAAYARYAELVDSRAPCNVRDLLRWRKAAAPTPLAEVESAEQIVHRFCTAPMSHGALSRETHETLAVAMNRVGGRSSSGEGGEARERLRPYGEDPVGVSLAKWSPRQGDFGGSAIKQVASGRFGVTPEYLVSARELEIKMAQGSKPGEGGQIPGHKVSEEIAALRGAVPGVPLVSPPPHHDIYSIEDLAQLIHDLKRVNPRAAVAVKLVALGGVGTIACGVAKGDADAIQISGTDGGTGASPLSSIRYAGLPWELGLADAQQALVRNGLRGRVRLRADGGLKTGRDVVLAALLGAEEFGFGTAALVAVGCIMARQCHLDTCPVGVATQREKLRKRYPGKPEHLISFLLYVAEQVRRHLAELGVRRLDEILGRVDLLETREHRTAKGVRLDLDALLADPDPSRTKPRRHDPDHAAGRPIRATPGKDLDDEILRAARPRLTGLAASSETGATQWFLERRIGNQDRSVGARLSGEIALATHGEGLPEGSIVLRLRGVAGQSLGVFLERGVTIELVGEAQDYVGKGMHGGEIVLTPPPDCPFTASENVIAGNTLLYGATGGRLFAAGRVGERFAVRNSGAEAVVEGCGDHGGEYMTKGTLVVLGPTGRNFGAGMSGGTAYVWDPHGDLARRLNEDVAARRAFAARAADDPHERELRALVERHAERTGSVLARRLLGDWDSAAAEFWRVTSRLGGPEDDLGGAGRDVDSPRSIRLDSRQPHATLKAP